MHNTLKLIPDQILSYAKGALAQANTHAVFFDPGNEHWKFISVINTAHAGELFLKAIIAKEHPLLIFRDLFSLDDGSNEILLEDLIKRGKTHDFEKLPKLLWAVTGERIPNYQAFERLRNLRNAVQHFCASGDEDFGRVSLEFIYTIIDPLIKKHFNLYAIEFHEDHSIGYDYVVGCLLRHQLHFSVPDDFHVGEIDISDEVHDASTDYKNWLRKELARIGKSNLFR